MTNSQNVIVIADRMLTFLRGAGVMSSKSDVLMAKLSKLTSSKLNAACEALLEAKLPNKGARM